MASYTKYLLYTLVVSCIFLFSEATKKSGGITLDLVHRDSKHSPTYDFSVSHYERLRKVLHRSFSRKTNLHLRASLLKSTTTQTSDEFASPLTPVGGEYLIKIQIGTPPVDVLAIADTGSDLTWTQCKPCSGCYKQNDPLFDPHNTSSYRSVSCESEQCNAVGTSSCSSGTCIYQMSYGDQSYSLGQLAVETVTFGSDSGDGLSFEKVVFGCGHENAGTFNETASGIVGLGGGSLSIIKQLSKSIGGRFSYCLTYLDSKVSSKIKFGTNAVVSGHKMVSTPMVRKAPDTFYYLTLESISVGGKKFTYRSTYNDEQGMEDREGNIIIDSGTTLTFIPRDMYDGLETALINSIKATRGTDSQRTFNLCYELPSDGKFNPPPIVVHFSGADVTLPQGSTFLEIEKGLVCLTLVPSDDMCIFGNLHQMNYHIGYDLENQKVNFLPTDCSKSK